MSNLIISDDTSNVLAAKNNLSISVAEKATGFAGIKKYSKGIVCPVCQEDNSDCRYRESPKYKEIGRFCYTHRGMKLGERVGDYVVKKERTVGTHTATFALAPEGSKPEHKEKRVSLRPPENLEKFVYRYRLSREECHRGYSLALSELDLYSSDRKDLKERGYTDEQIDEIGFKSLPPNYKFQSDLPSNLPGLTEFKTFSCSADKAIIIPQVIEGKIISLCFEDRSSTFNSNGKRKSKYRPISSERNPVAIGGEPPLCYYIANPKCNIYYVIEGGGHKAIIAHYRLGINVIAPVGGNFPGCPEQFYGLVNRIRKINPDAEFIYVPDGGDSHNEAVRGNVRNRINSAKDSGLDLKILWWDQISKGSTPDIDEITVEKFQEIQNNYITLDQFLKVGEEAIAEQQEKRKVTEIDYFLFDSEYRPDKGRTYLIDNWIDLIFLLVELIESGEFDGSIIQIKADTGTGKSFALSNALQYLKGLANILNNFHIFAPRNTIGHGLCGTLTRPREEDNYKGLPVLHVKDADNLTADVGTDLVSCPESVNKLIGGLLGKRLIYDESEAIFEGFVHGQTANGNIGKYRADHKKVLANASTVILMDAGATDRTARAYQQMSGNKELNIPEKKLIKIEFKLRNPRVKTFHFVESLIIQEGKEDQIKSGDVRPLLDLIDIYKRPFIGVDSIKLAKALEKIFTEQGKKVLCIHGQNSSEERMELFLKDVNKFLRDEQPDIVIGSPTLCQGVSFNASEKYFDSVFIHSVGVIGVKDLYQLSNRVRDNTLPHFVFCPKVSNIPQRDAPKDNQPGDYLESQFAEIDYRASLHSEEIQKAVEEAKTRIDEFWTYQEYRFGITEKIEKKYFRETAQKYFESQGHIVVNYLDENQEPEKSGIAEKKKEVSLQEDADLFNSLPKEVKEAREDYKKHPVYVNLMILRRAILLDRVPGIENADFFVVDFVTNQREERDYMPNLRRKYLFEHLDKAAQLDKKYLINKIENCEDLGFPDLNKSDFMIVSALEDLGVKKLIGVEYEHTNKDLEDIISKLRKSKVLRDILLKGQKIAQALTEQMKYSILKKLVAFIGYEHKPTQRKIVTEEGHPLKGVRVRHYELRRKNLADYDEDVTNQLYEMIGKRVEMDLLTQEEKEEVQKEYNISPNRKDETYEDEKVYIKANISSPFLGSYLHHCGLKFMNQMRVDKDFSDSQKDTLNQLFEQEEILDPF